MKARFCRLIFLFIVFSSCFLPLAAFAQDDDGFLEIRGVALKNGRPMEGAVVTVLKNGQKYSSLATKRNGKYFFELEFGCDYVIVFKAPDHYEMKIQVSAKLPKTVRLPIYPVYQIDVPFFELVDASINKRSFDRPITKVFYDEKAKRFKDDEAYVNVYAEEKPATTLSSIKAETTVHPKAEPKTVTQPVINEVKKEEPVVVNKEPLKQAKATVDNQSKKNVETEAIALHKKTEKREQQIKENKKVKNEVENNILRIVAESERRQNEARFKQQAVETYDREIIKIIETDKALKRALMEQKALKELSLAAIDKNRNVKSKTEAGLLKNIAAAEVENNKKVKSKQPGLVLPEITQTIDTDIYKETVTTIIKRGTAKDEYKKISYHWGGLFYFKNDESISASKYYKQVNIYGPHTK